ncbi:HEPN domain-containing protein [Pannus brasiliensis CCIBt3594]|uniref:HEPN domain-containing protein n=1 Tax=Pannus brasiliensis CCIBt3594 TaxID=1427578 RepID=A0AAW9QTZ5_9CHRO
MNKIFKQRFDELEIQATKVEVSNSSNGSDIDYHVLLNWKIKVKNLLSKVCGENSQYYQQFEKEEESSDWTNHTSFKSLKAIFLAAKEDFEGGYLSSIRSLVQAEVFESELEQANELLNNGYLTAAAVIAGIVLETALRDLCDRKGIERGKQDSMDKMNVDLAKAGVYNKLMQKRITALADIRNSAAHGKPDEFTKQNVIDMIREVSQFLTNYLES